MGPWSSHGASERGGTLETNHRGIDRGVHGPRGQATGIRKKRWHLKRITAASTAVSMAPWSSHGASGKRWHLRTNHRGIDRGCSWAPWSSHGDSGKRWHLRTNHRGIDRGVIPRGQATGIRERGGTLKRITAASTAVHEPRGQATGIR